jgi:hypothetical protein
MPAATAAADPLDDPPGVCGRADRLSHDDCAKPTRLSDHCSIERRLMACVNRRTVGTGHLEGVEHVLHANRYARQRSYVEQTFGIDPLGLFEHQLPIQVDPRMHLGFALVNALQIGLRHLYCRQASIGNPSRNLSQVEISDHQVVSAIVRVPAVT